MRGLLVLTVLAGIASAHAHLTGQELDGFENTMKEMREVVQNTLTYVIQEAKSGNAEAGQEFETYISSKRAEILENVNAEMLKKGLMDGTLSPEQLKSHFIQMKVQLIEVAQHLKGMMDKLPEVNRENIKHKLEEIAVKLGELGRSTRQFFHEH